MVYLDFSEQDVQVKFSIEKARECLQILLERKQRGNH